jgi:hypothetical protein
MPHGFGPKIRAERLLRQGAGLMPGPTTPRSKRSPEVQALLNLQLGAGMITEPGFQKAMAAPPRAAATQGAGSPFQAAFQRRPQQFQQAALMTGRERIRARQREWREQFLPRGTTRGRFEATSRLEQQQELRGQPGMTRAGAEAQRRVGQRDTLRGMTRAQARAQERMSFF